MIYYSLSWSLRSGGKRGPEETGEVAWLGLRAGRSPAGNTGWTIVARRDAQRSDPGVQGGYGGWEAGSTLFPLPD